MARARTRTKKPDIVVSRLKEISSDISLIGTVGEGKEANKKAKAIDNENELEKELRRLGLEDESTIAQKPILEMSPKRKLLKMLVSEFQKKRSKKDKKKLIIVSQQACNKILAKTVLEKDMGLTMGEHFYYIEKGGNDKLLQEFQNKEKDSPYILVSTTGIISTGYNLDPTCDSMILLDVDTKVDAYMQMLFRIVRVSQDTSCNIVFLLSESNYDKRLWDISKKKMKKITAMKNGLDFFLSDTNEEGGKNEEITAVRLPMSVKKRLSWDGTNIDTSIQLMPAMEAMLNLFEDWEARKEKWKKDEIRTWENNQNNDWIMSFLGLKATQTTTKTLDSSHNNRMKMQMDTDVFGVSSRKYMENQIGNPNGSTSTMPSQSKTTQNEANPVGHDQEEPKALISSVNRVFYPSFAKSQARWNELATLVKERKERKERIESKKRGKSTRKEDASQVDSNAIDLDSMMDAVSDIGIIS
jgi:hypothetical protein